MDDLSLKTFSSYSMVKCFSGKLKIVKQCTYLISSSSLHEERLKLVKLLRSIMKNKLWINLSLVTI